MEMLVVLTLLGLLFTVLFSSLGFGFSSWRREKTHLGADDDIRSVQSLLRRSLQQVYPYFKAGDGAQTAHVDFSGGARRMEFLAPAPAALAQASRAREILDVEDRSDGLTLSLSIRPELSGEAKPSREVLISGLKSVEFAYYGKSQANASANWQGSWENRTVLPDLIRISLSFQDSSPPSWPDFIVHPQNVADVSCVYDPLTKYCRGRS